MRQLRFQTVNLQSMLFVVVVVVVVVVVPRGKREKGREREREREGGREGGSGSARQRYSEGSKTAVERAGFVCL